MKKLIIIVVLFLTIIPTFSQVSTPLSNQSGARGEASSPYCEGLEAVLLSLQQLKDSALRNNIAIRNAEHDIDAAHQQRKEAFTKYFPSVSGTALTFNANRGMAKMNIDPQEYIPSSMAAMLSQMLPAEALMALSSPISMSMMKNGTIASLMAMQPVFAGGQIVNGNRLARVGEDVSQLQMQLKEQEVERQTEQYYWQLVSLQEKKRTLDAVDTLLANIYKDVEVAVRAGVALRNDLLQVELRQNDIASQRLKLENGIFIIKQLLGQFCGLSRLAHYSGGEGMSYSFDIVVPNMNLQDDSLPSLLEEESGVTLLPEYQLLQQQVKATDLQRKMEIGKNLPTLAVGAGYNYHNLMDNDRTFAMLFATVTVPISDWWGGSHAIKRRTIEHQKAVEQLEDNTQLLQIRMQNAYNAVVESHQQLQLAQRGIEQAEENLRLNRDYYRAGTSTMNALLEAQLLYQQAQDKRTDAYANLQSSLLDYRQATGK